MKTCMWRNNLTEDNLRYAVRLGGLAAPSLVVGNIDTGAFNNFGEITLLARPELLGLAKGAHVRCLTFTRLDTQEQSTGSKCKGMAAS